MDLMYETAFSQNRNHILTCKLKTNAFLNFYIAKMIAVHIVLNFNSATKLPK
jgi:hypothetical protein